MGKDTKAEVPVIRSEPGSPGSYCAGFALSVVLTLAPYLLVTNRLLEGGMLVGVLMMFAVAQLIVQAVFFLHLGQPGSRWNMLTFLFMLLVVIIVALGSLFIMNGLNASAPAQTEQLLDLEKQKGF